MKKSVASVFALGMVLSSAASAALVEVESPVIVNKLFTTEFKVSQNINAAGSGGQRGHDIFLREGESSDDNESTNYDWKADFDYNQSFDWSLSLADSGATTLTFDGITLQHTAKDGTWNGLEFWIRQSGKPEMNDVSVSTTVDGQQVALAEGAQSGGFTFTLEDFAEFTSVAGTLNFSWTATSDVGAPNGNVALSIKALELEPASVPAPATALLSLMGFGLLAARRIKK